MVKTRNEKLLASQEEFIEQLTEDKARLQKTVEAALLENKALKARISELEGATASSNTPAALPVKPLLQTSAGKAVIWLPKTIKELNAAKAPALVVNTHNMFHRGYHITDEQQYSVDLAKTGGDLKIEAGAGSGKTSALAAISAEFARKRGLYIAFNKAIVTDAQKVFNHSTQCRTGHSLAFREIGHRYANNDRLKSRLTSEAVIRALSLTNYHDLSAWTVATLLINWVARFCQGGDAAIGVKNVPWDYMKLLTREGDKAKAYEIGKIYAMELKPHVTKLWELLSDPDGTLPITHDIYLKVWALTNPRLPYDFILFDEAQDANGVMMTLVHQQNLQKIWVGDRRQQIYSWRGAVNAMDEIQTDHVSSLTRSFRYGQPIAEMANVVLRNFLEEKNFSIVGSPSVQSTIGVYKNPKAILCRTNRTAISELMKALSDGLRVHMAGGVSDLILEVESAEALMQGRRPRSPALQVFKTWNQLVEYSETEAGADLAPLVKILDQWSPRVLLEALRKTEPVQELEADVVIATVHKTKGREFDTVRLTGDFAFPSTPTLESKMPFSPEEGRLLYVGLTRAKFGLDITDCLAAQVALEGIAA